MRVHLLFFLLGSILVWSARCSRVHPPRGTQVRLPCPPPCCWPCPGSWSASGSCSVFARTSLWISGLSWPGLLFGCLLCTNRTYIQSCWGLGRNGQVFGSELSQEQGTHSHLPSPSVRPSNSGRGQRWGARLFLFPGDALCDGGPSSTPCPVSVAHRTQNYPGAQVWVL